MKFETVRIHFLSEVFCCLPEILLPWQALGTRLLGAHTRKKSPLGGHDLTGNELAMNSLYEKKMAMTLTRPHAVVSKY